MASMWDTCIACGHQVRLHFRNGRMIGCNEVAILVSERIPAYPRGWAGCTQASIEGEREARKIERRQHAKRSA